MFLALRALGHQRGRFLLMGAVIGLLALLTVMLSGLSTGLVNDGVSGLQHLPASAVAFDEGTKEDNGFSRSVVDADQRDAWAAQDGVADAELFGVSLVNGTTTDGEQVDLTLFGVDPGSFLAPEAAEGDGLATPGGIVVSDTARQEGIEIGDTVELDRVGTELTVVGFTGRQDTFGHVDVAYLPLATWQYLATGRSLPGEPTADLVAADHVDTASVVALRTADDADLADAVDVAAGDTAAGTTTRTLDEAFHASPGYTAETTTIEMIQVFLYAIAALVVGAFFSVWTVQRQHELAVLRAVGAPTAFLLRDGVTQAATVLAVFSALGVGAGVGLGALMPAGMPFALEAAPVALATALMIGLGLLGAALAVLRIVRIDPLTALGGQR
ncbi:putative ABC transport system permease protein [Isoptericola jiangsuensis]|uniref:Putative ABC transport system permease protein n=1 Tax=Isoptericola jiangsuensis TaxID=548579 RepID=A0A2A9ESM4_9MICO|nr:ABC transporter permease [Isoptericola jiangsuensis]PFG42014.1 putative ABC transport system permease protein [Isoptericola jiangsuensis]